MLGQALGGLVGYATHKNPYDAAMGYSEQVPGTVSPYYDPYIQAGQRSLGTLEEQFNMLLSNPQAIMQMLGGGFEQSPGYDYQYNQAMTGSNNAAAAGGMLGSPSHQQQSATMATNLANQDYYNYLNKMFGLYGMGMEGMQGINQMGYGASNNLAQILAQNLMGQGALAAGSAANDNSLTADLFSSFGF